MKPKTMILMVVAVGCGLGASFMTSRYLAQQSTKVAEEPKVQVVRVKQKVSMWNAIKEPEKYFELQEVPESGVPKHALTTIDKLKNQRLNKTLSEGNYVTEDDLLDPAQAGLAGQMKPGQRAVAIKVNAETLAGGFVQPGSRVDIVFTTRGGAPNAKTILQDMLVLAVDTQSNRDPAQQTILGSTVTLAATPEEAQRLALAATLGEMRLSLRPLGETGVVQLKGSKLDDLDRGTGDSQSTKEEEAPTKAAPVVQLPPLPPPAPPEPEPKKEEAKKEEPKEEEAPQPKPETHVLTINIGEYATRAIFAKDAEGSWKTAAGLVPDADEGPANRMRRLTPAPKTPAPAAPQGPAAGH